MEAELFEMDVGPASGVCRVLIDSSRSCWTHWVIDHEVTHASILERIALDRRKENTSKEITTLLVLTVLEAPSARWPLVNHRFLGVCSPCCLLEVN